MSVAAKVIVSASFFIYLLVGLSIYGDYGVHTDEYHNQHFGNKWLKYITKSIEAGAVLELEIEPHDRGNRKFTLVRGFDEGKIKAGKHDALHGPAFELFLAANKKLRGLTDPRDVILMRHLDMFLLFFFSVLVFFHLGKNTFNDWKLGLLGCCILVLHPRIFAHSFFNTVDIAFLVFYLIGAFTLMRFLTKRSYRSGLLHALACAVLVDIRVAGLILPMCTFVMLSAEFFLGDGKKDLLKKALLYGVLFLVFMFALWPFLWSSPVENFLSALSMSKFNYATTIRPPTPWDYNPLWIAVTTPPPYLVLFVAGLIYAMRGLARSPKQYYRDNKAVVAALILFCVPLVLPMIFQTSLFNGWRHHYFVYPMFVLIALAGVRGLLSLPGGWLSAGAQRVWGHAMSLIIVSALVFNVYVICNLHPHQYSYGNVLSGEHKRLARFTGALDYWAVSVRGVMEHLLENNDGEIRLYSFVGIGNGGILPPEDRNRLKFVTEARNAHFVITVFRILVVNRAEEYYSVEIDGEKLSAAYIVEVGSEK